MEENLTSIKRLKGIKVFRGKRIPHNLGKIHSVVFYPDRSCVAGFITKRMDFLLMFKRKGHFISIKSYYMYEGLAFARPEKGTIDKAAYKALDLDPDDCVEWLGLPVVTEDGQHVGVVTDVTFAHITGEVRSVEASLGTVGKVLQGSRTIPIALIKGYSKDANKALSLETKSNEAERGDEERPARYAQVILVANEALALDIENGVASKAGKKVTEMANNAGVDTAKVSEKAKSVAATAGAIGQAGAVAAGKQLKKTKGMFSAFKEEYDKARHSD